MPQFRSSAFTSRSIPAATGASQALFAAKTYADVVERVVFNPNAAGNLWLNLVGGVAAANAADCIPLAPLAGVTLYNTNAVTVIGAANAVVSAFER